MGLLEKLGRESTDSIFRRAVNAVLTETNERYGQLLYIDDDPAITQHLAPGQVCITGRGQLHRNGVHTVFNETGLPVASQILSGPIEEHPLTGSMTGESVVNALTARQMVIQIDDRQIGSREARQLAKKAAEMNAGGKDEAAIEATRTNNQAAKEIVGNHADIRRDTAAIQDEIADTITGVAEAVTGTTPKITNEWGDAWTSTLHINAGSRENAQQLGATLTDLGLKVSPGRYKDEEVGVRLPGTGYWNSRRAEVESAHEKVEAIRDDLKAAVAESALQPATDKAATDKLGASAKNPPSGRAR